MGHSICGLSLTLHCSRAERRAVKKLLLIDDECSYWYNRVGDFLLSVWDRRKEILYGNGQVYEVSQTNPTRECEVNGTECYGG